MPTRSTSDSPLASVVSVAVGSTNPVKLAATRAVFQRVARAASVEAVSVESTVPAQPIGDEETVRGALARARAARAVAQAELGVGIEGGVVRDDTGSLRTCAWAAVVGANDREGVGGSLAMQLPPRVAELIRDEGLELGVAMDRLTGERNTKHGKGAVGILTSGLVDRQAAYEVILTYALAPFLTPELWTRGD
jgi:inosine/xanthosine triphosphatase